MLLAPKDVINTFKVIIVASLTDESRAKACIIQLFQNGLG